MSLLEESIRQAVREELEPIRLKYEREIELLKEVVEDGDKFLTYKKGLLEYFVGASEDFIYRMWIQPDFPRSERPFGKYNLRGVRLVELIEWMKNNQKWKRKL